MSVKRKRVEISVNLGRHSRKEKERMERMELIEMPICGPTHGSPSRNRCLIYAPRRLTGPFVFKSELGYATRYNIRKIYVRCLNSIRSSLGTPCEKINSILTHLYSSIFQAPTEEPRI